MVKKSNWRTRTKGTKRQIGQRFILDSTSSQTKKAKLPKLKGKAVMRYPTGKVVRYVAEDMPLEYLDANLRFVQEPNPENFEQRVQHFIKMYHNGETIPPILFHRLKDGSIEIKDGRARIEAFRRLGVKKIPAVENGVLSSIKSGITKAFHGTKGFAEGASKGAGKWKHEPVSVAHAVGRRAGVTAKSIASSTRKAAASAIEHGKAVYNILEGKGTTVKGQDGGGDIVIPSRRSTEPVTAEKPLVHRPCVIEKKVKGKVLRVYGTLLDPRTNPRYMQKYGYTDIE
jgi:hypothetical protein